MKIMDLELNYIYSSDMYNNNVYMKYFKNAVLLIFLFCFNSCASRVNENEIFSESDSLMPPLERRKPESDFLPAFKGQTRAPGLKTKQNYKVSIITSDLQRPWGIAELPEGNFILTEKSGHMRIVSKSGNISEPISGIPEVNSSGQGGLLGITLDPDFKSNRKVYWTFSENRMNGTLTSVAKGTLSADYRNMENVIIIYRATPEYKGILHYGSRILFDSTGHIVFSTGERSDKVMRHHSQNLNSSLGKIIRINTDGKAAPGNPFLNRSDARPEIYSYGHRNVQGLAFHPVSGELWENEFGPRGGDELNRIEPGKNYGWPVITYGIEYMGSKVGDGLTFMAGMEQPVYYWDPVLSPSGMTFYSSDDMKEWKNNLFICGLNSNHIARLVIENNKVIGEERILENEKQRFRDIIQGNDGALYSITDEGRMYRINAD